MTSQKQIKNQSEQVKRLMKEKQYFFIKNNEKFRNQLQMNQMQLSYSLKYLIKTGFLKSRSCKIYQIKKNKIHDEV